MSALLTTPDTSATQQAQRQPLLSLLLGAIFATGLAGAAVLMALFGWPDVLDEPASVALPAFAVDQTAVVVGFTLLLVSSLLLIPVAVGLESVLTRPTAGTRGFTVLGISGAVLQILGWVRWPAVVPGLADSYLDPAATEASRAATASSYELINAYAGGALGEWMGWLFTGPWAVAVAIWVLRSGLPRWLGWSGLAVSALWAVPLGLVVPFPALSDTGPAFTANGLWYVWLGVLGVTLALRPVQVR